MVLCYSFGATNAFEQIPQADVDTPGGNLLRGNKRNCDNWTEPGPTASLLYLYSKLE